MARNVELMAVKEEPRVARVEKKRASGFLKNVLTLIPNFLKLLYRLFTDSRVPTTEKVFLIGAIAYVISPIDLIPDFIPFIGEVDDLYLVALTLLRMLTRTPDHVVREHWDGGGDIARISGRIAQAASYILPKRVARILIGKVVIAPKIKGGILHSPASEEFPEKGGGRAG